MLCLLHQLIDLFFQRICSRGRVHAANATTVVQASQHSILLPDSHSMQLRLCAPTLCRALIFIYIGCECVCVGELNSARGNEVNFEASRSVPRATGAPPPSPQGPKLLPHLHIYVRGLKSSRYYAVCLSICGMFYFEKHSCKILFREFPPVSFRNISLLEQQHNKAGVCSLSFDPLSELLASPAACKARRSFFLN